MSMKTVTPQEHKISREQFWDKNKRLNRPISPHLTIYKMQMTSVLSITHRGTGLGWSVILSGVGIGSIASNTTFPAALATLQVQIVETNVKMVDKHNKKDVLNKLKAILTVF